MLAMASAVAWADWVMSCYGVGSVAMSQMVRKTLEHENGGKHKSGDISKTISWIGLKLAQQLPGGVS